LSQTLNLSSYGNLVNTTTSNLQITQRLNTQVARTRASVADVRRVLGNTAWTTRTVPGLVQWRAFTWSADLGIFAALPDSSTGSLSMTSPDGVNWTTRSSAPNVTQGWSSMAWSPELSRFVATTRGASVVATSPDGVTWTTRSSAPAYNVIWVPELSIFVTSGSNVARTSTDAITWTARSLATANWMSVAWSPELSLLVAVAQSAGYVAVSSDGASWSTRSAPSDLWNSIAWSPELSVFVVYALSNGYVMRSRDATNWTTHATASISNGIVTWSPELSVFVAAGHQTSLGAYSRDGIRWTTYNLGTTYSFQSPCWSPELSRFVVLGYQSATSGGCATSPIVSSAYIQVTEGNVNVSAAVTASSLRVTSGGLSVAGNSNTVGNMLPGSLAYTLWIDGASYDQPLSIATAGDGSVYVTGYYSSTQANLYATDGTTIVQTLGNLSTAGTSAGFIAKYNSSGALQYTLRIDGTGNDQPVSIATAGDGSVYVTGYYTSTQANLYATNGTTIVQTLGNLGLNAGFIAKYNSSGALQYTVLIDGTRSDQPQSVTTASDGSVYVTGNYQSTRANLYATDGTTIVQTLGNLSTNRAGFIAKYSSSGALQYTLLIDGTGDDFSPSIATAADGSVYVTGYYLSTQANLYATDGTTIVQTLGNLDTAGTTRAGFIAKYNSSGALGYTLRIDSSGSRDDYPMSIATAGDGSVYVTGYYSSTQANFYATDGTTIVQTLGSQVSLNAGFIAKYSSSGALGYTLKIDGTDQDYPQSITTASDGSVYVTGYYKSTQANFYATDGTTIVGSLGNFNTVYAGFIAKYNSSGVLGYTLRIDGTGQDYPVSIATAAEGSVYVSGYYYSTQANFYATDGTTIVQTLGNLSTAGTTYAGFIAKYVDRIVTGGNLAIGTSTPTVQLDVSGGARVTGSLTAGKLLLTGYMNTYGNAVFTTSGTTAFASNIKTLSYRSRTSRANANNAVATWTTRVSAVDNQWVSVVWAPELSIFAAVSSTGSTNRIMTSPDGINWTSRTTPSNTFTAITWSPELSLFVVVAAAGTGNRVMTSPDGITWTTRSSAADNSWNAIVWSPELRLFVAVGYTGTGNRVMTSPDGITWTTRASAADNDWYDVAWSPELSLFVAVAATGTGNRVMTSPNGLVWTTRSSAADNTWYDVVWSPELSLFAAVSFDGTNRVMTSPDGFTWTTRTAAAANQWRGLTWSPELSVFVAVSADGAGSRLMTSHDGIRWTTRTSNVTSSWRSVAWSPELSRFVVVGSGAVGINVMTSPIALPAARSVPLVSPAYLTATEGDMLLTGTVNVTGQVTAGSVFTDTFTTDTFTTTTVTTANAQADFATIANVALTSFTPANLPASSLTVVGPALSQTLNLSSYGNLVNTTTSNLQITQRLNTQVAR
ncbi:hypothetical protein EBZ39_10060, partial [bacterium]|nr:hypothetical protein [bacterium]